MFRRTLALAAIFAAAVTGSASAADMPVKAAKVKAPETPYFLVNENSLSYHYEFTATNPGAGYTPKHVGTFSHFDVWAYGTNFINVDWLKATSQATPASPCPIDGAGCSGYSEIYAFLRSTLGWNQLTKSNMFSIGPLKNISYAVGVDVNTDNTFLASAKRSVQAGLQFDFATPFNGNLSLSGFAYKEWQNDGFGVRFGTNPTGNVDFDTTWGFGANYTQPLGFLPAYIPLTYKAIVGMHGPKGTGEPLGAGTARTTEIFTQQTLDLDVGKIVTGKPNMFAVWVGYRWWKNKFGLEDAPVGAPTTQGLQFTTESTWLVGSTWAF